VFSTLVNLFYVYNYCLAYTKTPWLFHFFVYSMYVGL